MLSHLSNKIWIGDFWEHAACVRELATHPFSPRHPILLVDKPYALYSPYALGIALLSRSANLGSITSLAVAGIINLLLLLISLRFFISSYVKEDAEKTAFYTLLFMLFLWGPDPWFWSAFLHMGVLGYVLPYPATFATALMFLSFALYLRILEGARPTWFIALFLIIPAVLLIHPNTALVLSVGLTAFTVGFRQAVTRNIVLLLVGAYAFSIMVAFFYPYYSLGDLVLVHRQVFHEDSFGLYQRVVPRVMPSLIGLIPLLSLLKTDKRNPLVLFFMLLICIYVSGALTDSYGYGRVIFYIVLLPQLALAMWVAKAETQGNWKIFALLALYLGIASPSLPMRSLSAIKQYLPGRESNYSDLLFLSRYTKQYDVILSDVWTSLAIPALGGKVVAYPRAMYWVDMNTRSHDVDYFFSDKASESDRWKILRHYRVNYILVNMKTDMHLAGNLKLLPSFGGIVYQSSSYVLIKIDESKAHDTMRPATFLNLTGRRPTRGTTRRERGTAISHE